MDKALSFRRVVSRDRAARLSGSGRRLQKTGDGSSIVTDIYFQTMPRKARLCIPGCVHHVMARGLDGMVIFPDDQDRRMFLSYLGAALARAQARCYAWAIMPNHFHLVVRTGDLPLSTLMKSLNSRYASTDSIHNSFDSQEDCLLRGQQRAGHSWFGNRPILGHKCLGGLSNDSARKRVGCPVENR